MRARYQALVFVAILPGCKDKDLGWRSRQFFVGTERQALKSDPVEAFEPEQQVEDPPPEEPAPEPEEELTPEPEEELTPEPEEEPAPEPEEEPAPEPVEEPAPEPGVPAPPPPSRPALNLFFDFTQPNLFTCDGLAPCPNSANITIGGGTAQTNLIDLKTDTAAEWNNATATLQNVAVTGNSLTLAGNSLWDLDPAWIPQPNDAVICYNFDSFQNQVVNVCDPGNFNGSIFQGSISANSARAGAAGADLTPAQAYVTTGYDIDNRSSNLTMMAWAKIPPNNERTRTLWGTRDGAIVIQINIERDQNGRAKVFVQNGTIWRRFFSTTTNLADGEWHHFALTFDDANGPGSTTGNIRMYIDGVMETTVSIPGYHSLHIPGVPLAIGALNYWNIRHQEHLIGHVDGFGLWRVALSDAEIQSIYNRQRISVSGQYISQVFDLQNPADLTTLSYKTRLPAGKPLARTAEGVSDYPGIRGNLSNGLLAMWHLDEASAPYADDSGNNHDSTSVEGAITSASGIIGQTVALSGAGIHVGNTINPQAISVAAWVKVMALPSTPVSLIRKGQNQQFDLQLLPSGQVRFALHDGTSWREADIPATSIAIDDNWNHIVAIYDRSFANADLVVYINGIQATALTDATLQNWSIPPSSGSLSLGGQMNGAGGLPAGWLDEVAIWNRGLTDTEVAELYQRGATQIELEVRTCADSQCANVPWLGTGGSQPRFSEWFNSSQISGGSPTGQPLVTMPFFRFENFPTMPANNRYWQYRLYLSSRDIGGACNNAQCRPTIEFVSLNERVGGLVSGVEMMKYRTGSFVNTTPIPFTTLSSITIQDGGRCFYQISTDAGATFYHHTQEGWAVAGSDSQANIGQDPALLALSELPTGNQLVIKTLAGGNYDRCVVESIHISGYQ